MTDINSLYFLFWLPLLFAEVR